ncbi:uroporphyrinogen decarboxylase family protein [Clostridium cylindrosporum]|uniref:Uroporphyrinogen-III decarboxylase n=1 Tax=Clostridium cylindrosporum DSM 605 TaxID=1121307 RepID=A0A0J8FZN0_CLOCY|nr:uroporphyrinogen decarboxylase family protein [Clostridium cylindrosporum]KMT21016.1 uroporphyrinogen-III decarboxylase [Clostridium cylindrosporum DSM 605]
MTLLEYINSENRGFFLPDMGTNGLFLTGYTAYEVYNDPNKQLEVAKKMNETFETDFIYSLCDGAIFCETLGLDLLKPDFDFPSVLNHPFTNIDALEKYEVPDPYKSGRMPVNLKSLELISKNVDKPLFVSIQGPFTLGIQLAGATHLLRCVIKEPEFVKKLLEFTTETVRRYAVAVKNAGAKYISIAEPATVTLSRDRFEKLIVPNLNKIYNDLNCWKALHICGDTTEFLDLMLTCNIDALSLDQIMDYEKVMDMVPKDIVLLGNLDPLELLYNSKEDKIKNETLKLLKKMRRHNNYLCAFGCNCMNDTPVKNLQAAIEAGRITYQELDEIKV